MVRLLTTAELEYVVSLPAVAWLIRGVVTAKSMAAQGASVKSRLSPKSANTLQEIGEKCLCRTVEHYASAPGDVQHIPALFLLDSTLLILAVSLHPAATHANSTRKTHKS